MFLERDSRKGEEFWETIDLSSFGSACVHFLGITSRHFVRKKPSGSFSSQRERFYIIRRQGKWTLLIRALAYRM